MVQGFASVKSYLKFFCAATSCLPTGKWASFQLQPKEEFFLIIARVFHFQGVPEISAQVYINICFPQPQLPRLLSHEKCTEVSLNSNLTFSVERAIDALIVLLMDMIRTHLKNKHGFSKSIYSKLMAREIHSSQ